MTLDAVLLARIVRALELALHTRAPIRLKGTDLAVCFEAGGDGYPGGYSKVFGGWVPGEPASPDEAQLVMPTPIWTPPLDEEGEPIPLGDWWADWSVRPDHLDYDLDVHDGCVVVTARPRSWDSGDDR